MAPPPRRPGPVAVESPASGPLHYLQSELLSAKAAWEQLGVRLAKSYTTAYGFHVGALATMKKQSTETSADALLFVFSIVSVGFAGGLVGGLMGPWVKKAGESAAHFAFREGIRGIAQQGAKELVKVGDEKLRNSARDSSTDPYTTLSPKEIAVDQDIRDRISSAFGPLLEAVEAMIDQANTVQASIAVGQDVLNNFRNNCPLITDQPEQKDIPLEFDAARAAELAIWVAWANERDWHWWSEVYAYLDNWTSSLRVDGFYSPNSASLSEKGPGRASGPAGDALDMNPVGDRLLELGKLPEVTSTASSLEMTDRESPISPERARKLIFNYMDLRKLRYLAIDDALPFRKLSGLRFQWDKTKPLQRVQFLKGFTGLKPVYKP